MTDILGREIVGYDEALYLKMAGFDGECTGYYHIDWPGEEHYYTDDERYECVGSRGLFRNPYSVTRAAGPSIRAAKLWYTRNNVRPFVTENN